MTTPQVATVSAGGVTRHKSRRKKFYALHTWVGFHLATLMALVLFTGTFATISNEIDWLIQSDMRVTPGDALVSWGKMEEAIHNYRPTHNLESLGSMKHDWFAYRARMIDEYGKVYFLHINQWTGEVTGTTPTLTVQRFFRDLHRYLFMPKLIGLPIVTSLAFILAISLYTGLKTTRKWREMAMRVRMNCGVRVAIGDAHKAAGLWASWFFVVIIITGIWYLVEFGSSFTGNHFAPERPAVSENQLSSYGPVIPAASAETLIAAAMEAYPELEPRLVAFPALAGQTATVSGRNKDFLIRDHANSVFLDPADASVIKVQRASDIGWISYLNEVADPLHFGYLGGLATKLIWFVFGLAMTGLSVSGVWLTWKRLKTMRMSSPQRATLPILLAMMIFGIFWLDRQLGPDIPDQELSLGTNSAHGLSGEIFLSMDSKDHLDGRVRLVLSTRQGRPNISAVSVLLPGLKRPVTPDVGRLGRTTQLRAKLPKRMLNNADHINATLDLYSGERFTFRWELRP